ncbi:zona pellucida sperm-binding protein 3-like [Choloepus didactylus]|uniref:zona pellucida sperm-binding protein 3-like n=1 Tax=Choloepus didactylus TaxID=27675 RepID=UPI00189FC96C|nr:zona pellucida sperm-binding protein 3-like [Choloepus didactylus]
MDGKDARSHFLPRKVPERLELSFQAFGFTDNPDDVYVHCQLLVWDPKVPPDATKKACSFHGDTNRWKLLDNASLSSVRLPARLPSHPIAGPWQPLTRLPSRPPAR